VLMHENMGGLSERMDVYRDLVGSGANVLAMAYRGYSGNAGNPSEKNLKRDGDAIINFLNDTQSVDKKISSKIDNRLIYLYGRGLGSSVSTYMVLQAPTLFRGVILQNAFTSTPDYLR